MSARKRKPNFMQQARAEDMVKAKVERLRAKPAEPTHEEHIEAAIEFRKQHGIDDELHLRCMMAAKLLGGMYADPNVHPGNPKHPGMVHDAVDALLAEARRRKEAKPPEPAKECEHDWHRELVGPDPSGESVAVDTCRKCQRKEVGRDLA